jgi:zinc/manganese transport system substrate-binding protein
LSMRTVLIRLSAVVVVGVLAMGVVACGGTVEGRGAEVVVSSNILGDVVHQLVGDLASVEVLMPPNADPHEFAASASQAADMRSAQVLVVNGFGFESGLADAISAARDDGVKVIQAARLAPRLRTVAPEGGGGRPATDPHVFTDPARMAVVVERLAGRLADSVPALDTDAFRTRTADYAGSLRALDAAVERTLAVIPREHRILVTNHDALGYFADRYGFRVLGAVIPSLSTLAEPSASDLADLAQAVQRSGVPAIFADTSSPKRLSAALAHEGHGVRVVTLYIESLGSKGSGAATYEQMVRTNARRIARALG